MVSDHPIFIGGMYKSGTSLLRAMLGHHSRLFAGLETRWLHEQWEGDVTIARRSWLERLSVFFNATVGELEAVCGETDSVEMCLDRIMTYLAARAGKARWIEKTPGNVGAIARIKSYWPRAHIIHIVRDPRDVYASMIESRKWINPEEFAERWRATVAAARSWLMAQGGTHPAYYELRYERLVCCPEDEMRKVLAFIGELFEPRVAAFSGQPEDFDRVRKATGKESPTLRRLAHPITTARVGVWRSIVTPEQWQAVDEKLAGAGSGEVVEELIAETDAIHADEVERL
jgi:hypothetical protein